MQYFYDCEFHERGPEYPIDLISIAIFAEDGRQFYAVNREMDVGAMNRNLWLMENVVPYLPIIKPPGYVDFLLDIRHPSVMRRSEIAGQLAAFIVETDRDDVELWADYGAYDHVMLAQLFGRMIDLPPQIPMFTNDFQQLWRSKGKPELPPEPENAHDALADARHLRDCYNAMVGA